MRQNILRMASAVGCLILPIAGAAIAEPATQSDALHVLNRLAFGPRPGDIEPDSGTLVNARRTTP